MYSLIESGAEISKAQQKLEATIKKAFMGTAVKNIGWQGGRQPGATLNTSGSYWYWTKLYKGGKTPRHLNWFGMLGVESRAKLSH